jgi:hypothetical protein
MGSRDGSNMRPRSVIGIKALVHQLEDIVAVLAEADAEDKRAVYDELRVNLASTRTDVSRTASPRREGASGFMSAARFRGARRECIRRSGTMPAACREVES